MDDTGKLILRVTVGGLMLFHGIAKLSSGIEFIKGMLPPIGLPPEVAYGVYVAELLVPVLLIIGFLTRPAALILVFDMLMAIILVHKERVFALNERGGAWAIEIEMFFLLAALAVVFLGAGRFSLSGGKGAWN